MRFMIGLGLGFAIGCARIAAHDATHALVIIGFVLAGFLAFGLVAGTLIDNRDRIRRALGW